MKKAFHFRALVEETVLARLNHYVEDRGIIKGHFIGEAIREKLERDDEVRQNQKSS